MTIHNAAVICSSVFGKRAISVNNANQHKSKCFTLSHYGHNHQDYTLHILGSSYAPYVYNRIQFRAFWV
jgi:hypothetical protein